LDGIEIMAAEIQIACEQPVRPDVRGLATHGGQRSEMMTKGNFSCLCQFLRCDAGLLYFVDDAHRQLLGCIAFLWIDSSVDAKQTRVARRVGKRRYPKRQTRLFADAPAQARAAPVAEDARK